MSLTAIIIGVAAILVVSFIFSMVGQGGGVLYVPILIALGMGVHQAAATSLFVILGTALSAAIIYRSRRTVDWKLALAIEPPTIIMAFFGGMLANSIDATVLKIIFAVVLVIAGIFMLAQVTEKDSAEVSGGWGHWNRKVGDISYRVRLPGLMPVTAIAGFVAGMIGIAGGVFKMPAMVLIGRVPIRIAIGTSSLMVMATSLSGLIGHITGGSFNVLIALPLAGAAFVGGRVGSSFSLRVKAPKLKIVFTVMLLLTAAWMITSIFIQQPVQ